MDVRSRRGRAATHLLLADPYTFPGALLGHLNNLEPRPVVVGGMASGASGPGEAILFRDDEVLHEVARWAWAARHSGPPHAGLAGVQALWGVRSW